MRSCLNACVPSRHETTVETLEFIFAQGRAKVKLGRACWRSLMLTFNHQLIMEKDPNATIPRLRVLSDRISRVLVFVYFCRGLSGNTEERPTCRVYIEILTCHAIFYHLEDSRSHKNEREGDRVRRQGTHPTLLGARPATVPNQIPFHGSCSTDLRDQGKPCD